jgi:hypothetical protein
MSFIGLLVLAAAPVAADAPASVAPTGQCQVSVAPVMRVRSDRPTNANVAWSVRRVTDVRFEARLRPAAEAAGVELHIFTPNGHLYRKIDATVTEAAPPPPSGPRRRPKPKAEVLLPVAGTNIVRSGLYGQWKVVPHLPDDPRPCGRTLSFGLAP